MLLPEVITVNISELEDNSLSVNEQDEVTFDKLQESLKKYGWLEMPVVLEVESQSDSDFSVDGKRYRIISGRHRIRAAEAIGEKTVRVQVVPPGIFESREDEFNLVNSMNTVKGVMTKKNLAHVITKEGLDPTKIDVFKFPIHMLMPKPSEKDMASRNLESLRNKRLHELTMVVSKEIAKSISDERDELVTILVVDDKAAALIRIPFKTGERARKFAPDIKSALVETMTNFMDNMKET